MRMSPSRHHPIFSPIALLGTLLLLVGLGVAVWLTGGEAFSPGDLTALGDGAPRQGFASHAAFEPDCNLCHVPAVGVTAEKCEACHTEITAERVAADALHGRLENVAQCAQCHPDHRGRQFDVLEPALAQFDHTAAGFSLALHATDYANVLLKCEGCHTAEQFEFESAACVQCHRDYASAFMADHTVAFPADCRTCHDGVDAQSHFDHAATVFPLEGEHASAACAACHTATTAVTDTPTACENCHAEPAFHLGVFGTDCAVCHAPTGWAPAQLNGVTFDHAQTGFALTTHQQTTAGAPFTCNDCHTATGFEFAAQTCGACHTEQDATFMTAHIATFGQDCLQCHDGTGNLQNFDHAVVFALDGRHAEIECAACHVEQRFKGTPNTCVGCHAEPVIHAGVFGTECAACHSTTAWQPAALKSHVFPLDHGNTGTIPCTTCHTATYTAYTCYGCHEHTEANIIREHAEENIVSDRLNDCAACHPTGEEDKGD